MRSMILIFMAAFVAFSAQLGPFDVIIRNARILDGSGNPWYSGEIGIKDGRIQVIHKRIDAPTRTVIDAAGMAVTPGFIDMHTHSEYSLLRDGNGESKIRQGVTLEVAGENSSPAPRKPDMISDLRQNRLTERWTTFREYFDIVNKKGIAGNLMSYVAAIFDPARVADRATFDNPHQYPVGIEYVLVNGTVVIEKGQHTGARPGRVVYGPGRTN